MIESSVLQKLVRQLHPYLRKRLDEVASEQVALRERWDKLRQDGETSESWVEWSEAQVEQAAVAWVLSCVFVRFLEDNHWSETSWITGPVADHNGHNRYQWALEHQTKFFQENPTASDREYLEMVFATYAQRPGFSDLFGPGHNPLWSLKPTAAGATALLEFFRQRDGQTGELKYSLLASDSADTRFLGDLYQDLSEAARKRFALLQTPDFVEEFILDRTLEPALRTFGLRPNNDAFRMIDPTCGSGHFLLGAFQRLLVRWESEAPGMDKVERVQKALDSIHGIDLNPFAVAIARFRLLLAAHAACGRRILGGPHFKLNLAVGDSLLHGPGELSVSADLLSPDKSWHGDLLVSAEYDRANQILVRGHYHAVVGNPPYIAVSDSSQGKAIRANYGSCFQRWTLSVPFTERFFQLAIASGSPMGDAGFVGLINSNNFTKREFGKKLIESFFPKVDLTEVLDTSGCYIPGHGTPTVILSGRNRPGATGTTVRAVLGIRGEPGKPENAAEGQVWSALVREVDHPGAETTWLSVVDAERETFHKHPWSLGGGGAGDVKEAIEGKWSRLTDSVEAVGIASVNGEDDTFILPNTASIQRLDIDQAIELVVGDNVREWSVSNFQSAVWLCDADLKLLPLSKLPGTARYLWSSRPVIQHRRRFGVPILERGMTWYEWQEIYPSKLRTPLSIAFGEVATHNHFVLCRGGMVFKQTAPVIKLPAQASLDDHLDLLSLLNSSTLAFWLRQVCHNKGDSTDKFGARVTNEAWINTFAFNSSNVEKAPLATAYKPERLSFTRELDALGQEMSSLQPERLFAREVPSAALLEATATRVQAIRERMIALQEELDWWVYGAYGILKPEELAKVARPLEQVPAAVCLGQRAFEIQLARLAESDEPKTSWFTRHGSTALTTIPSSASESERAVVQARLDLIESHPWLALLERPEHKRRWAGESWTNLAQKALGAWLLDRLESREIWSESRALTVFELSDKVGKDPAFVEVCRLYAPGQDRTVILANLMQTESVPAQAARRYTELGLRKRAEWEETWALQRREDAGESVTIPVPARYEKKDFQKDSYWSQRGKLDVPRERFVSLPELVHFEDNSPVYLWAGFDHAQKALALIDLWTTSAQAAKWSDDQKMSLLAAVLELLPWLHQWHNSIDPVTGESIAQAVENWFSETLRELSVVRTDIAGWKPKALAPVGKGKKAKIPDV